MHILEASKTKTKDKTSIRNTLEELAELNSKYLQTARNDADVHFYNALQHILHASALKLYGYTKDKDYEIQADLHMLQSQVEYLKLLEASYDKEKKTPDWSEYVELPPLGPGIKYEDQRTN